MNAKPPTQPTATPVFTYSCSDGDGYSELIEAAEPKEAAQLFVDSGEWGHVERTIWINVTVWNEDVIVDVSIAIHPEVPECGEDSEDCHDWQSPHSVVGGDLPNPGVWGNGPGIVFTEVCRHCGTYRRGNTNATNPVTGERGLRSITYDEAEEESLAWVCEQHKTLAERLDESECERQTDHPTDHE